MAHSVLFMISIIVLLLISKSQKLNLGPRLRQNNTSSGISVLDKFLIHAGFTLNLGEFLVNRSSHEDIIVPGLPLDDLDTSPSPLPLDEHLCQHTVPPPPSPSR